MPHPRIKEEKTKSEIRSFILKIEWCFFTLFLGSMTDHLLSLERFTQLSVIFTGLNSIKDLLVFETSSVLKKMAVFALLLSVVW